MHMQMWLKVHVQNKSTARQAYFGRRSCAYSYLTKDLRQIWDTGLSQLPVLLWQTSLQHLQLALPFCMIVVAADKAKLL